MAVELTMKMVLKSMYVFIESECFKMALSNLYRLGELICNMLQQFINQLFFFFMFTWKE